MILQAFPSGPLETNAYIVACPHTHEAAIVDPAPGSSSVIIPFLEKNQLRPVAMLITHSHWDHIGDAALLLKQFRVPVYIHQDDAENLEAPGADGVPCWLSFDGATPTHFVDETTTIQIGDLLFRVIHTPGHTPGGVCYYCPDEGVLLSGDTLFQGTIGVLSLPTARPGLMWPSLRKLAQLPPHTRVFPGHGTSTTIGNERWLAHAEEHFNI